MSYTDDLKPKPLNRKELNALMPKMPFNHLLGMSVSRVYADGVTLELEVTPELTNLLGTLHGGATASLIDAAIGVAVIGLLGGRPATTVELKLNYLRPATHGKVRARSKIIKIGKTLAFGTAEVHDLHGHLIAMGSATYLPL
jgi:acyl-CoA thioesterase